MRAIGWCRNRVLDWLRRRSVELAWTSFAAANVAAMIVWPSWETIPFHFVWISLTLVYGFRVWNPPATATVLTAVVLTTGSSILVDAFDGIQLWGELFEVPLMSAMFLAMVWHARRRQAVARQVQSLAESRAELLDRQERFLHDVSHELRTPVTIARGHLELLRQQSGETSELAIAIDELGRIERIIARLLLLAKSGRPDFLAASQVDVEAFLEDVFVRWAEVAPRGWVLGPIARGRVWADEEALRAALDALLENAVKYTSPHDTIELKAAGVGHELVIDVSDSGCGVPPEALDRIFERFARADDARSRTNGGVGLGLAIVSAIAEAHGGGCEVVPLSAGTLFSLRLPRFIPLSPPVAGAGLVEPVGARGRALAEAPGPALPSAELYQ
ncbi:MAG TPA: HAMP domain-containing sensor histidine kinase [Gaiellaceae bacterium]|nr:HAMP domain-containing sensor histidine kinase [Gaiellaceae bacterium]